MNLLEKYEPKTFGDIVGNVKKYKELLEKLKGNKSGIYTIIGKEGTGKSTFVKIFAKKFKYILREHQIDEKISKSTFTKSLIKKVILYDNIDSKTNENKIKNVINSAKENNKSNFVFIISTHEHRILKDKTICTTKVIKNRETTIRKLLIDIFKKEKVELSEKGKETIIKKLIENGEQNIRKIIQDMEMLINNKNKIKFTEANKELLSKNKKDKYYNTLFDIIPEVFRNSKNLLDKERLYYADSFIVSNTVFEYHLYGNNYKKDLDLMQKACESISIGDLLENNMNVNFSFAPYINYNLNVIPTTMCGPVKKMLNFPSCVSKMKKIKTKNETFNKQKIKSEELFHYKKDDIYFIEKLKNPDKKDKIFEIK